jgi:GNAT superfamily N-acetyltransferase
VSVPVVPSADLVRRVADAEARYTLSRLGVIGRLPGNPVGVETEDLGDGALAMSVKHLPNRHMNRVTGLTEAQAGEIPRLAQWYADRGIDGVFEILPGLSSDGLMKGLASAGYAQVGFHATLVAYPEAAPPKAPGVTVEQVDETTLDTFLETHCKGWSIANPQGFKANVAGWVKEPGWRLYLGRHDGQPAGSAILYQHGDIGYCADAAADPAFRGRGVHAALLHHRLAEAGRLGCTLVCSMADYLSTSHRNMVRAGFGLLHTKAVWARLPKAQAS